MVLLNYLLIVFILCSSRLIVEGLFDDLLDYKVCYDVIGCFDNSAPFTNAWHELPDSPEKVGITLTLYTRSGPAKGEPLYFNDMKKLVGTHYHLLSDTKVIVHGYMNNGSDGWIVAMRDEFLKTDTLNVIIVAWGPGAHAFYPKAVANTRVVGAVIAHFLTSLKEEYNVSMSRVHLLGHSLGAHISGYVGSRVKGIARISGMDPAGPMFESTDPAVRIDPSDADFVDCIHSDGVPLKEFGFGTMSAWCDADFYPNGGGLQPGCPNPVSSTLLDVLSMKILDAEDVVSCSHSRSHDLYINSIRRCWYRANPCDSFDDFQAGKCTCDGSGGRDECVSMGYHSADGQPRGSGIYYLSTSGTAPFC